MVGQVSLQRFLQAIAAVGHRDQVAHLGHADRTCCRTHLFRQRIEFEIHQVTGVLLVRRVQQGRVEHAMLGLGRLQALHRHAERIQADVGHRLAGGTRRGPLRLRLRRFDHPPFLLLRPQTLARCFLYVRSTVEVDMRTPENRFSTSLAASANGNSVPARHTSGIHPGPISSVNPSTSS